MMYILLQNIKYKAVIWAKCAHCMCTHMMVFVPAENSRTSYKCEGVKTATGIPPLHTQTRIC